MIKWMPVGQVVGALVLATGIGLLSANPTLLATAAAADPATPPASSTPLLAPGTCASPIVIPAQGGTFSGTTSGASAQEASCTSTSTAPEQVFVWTPSDSGTATLQTCSTTETTYDSVLYVRSGRCSDGAEFACNDDTAGCGTTTDPANPHRGSRVMLSVTAGQAYYLFVDGFSGASGSFVLSVIPPPSPFTPTPRPTDPETPTPTFAATSSPPPLPTASPTLPPTSPAASTPTPTPVTSPTPAPTTSASAAATSTPTISGAGTCAAALMIPPGGGTFSGITSGASAQEGSCTSTSTAPEQVFVWTPSASGTATLQTCSTTATTYDTVLYVRGGTCGDGAELSCNDDTEGCGTATDPANPHRGSRVILSVTAGQPYYLFVDGFSGAGGSFVLSVIPPGSPFTPTPAPTGPDTPAPTSTATSPPPTTPPASATPTSTPTVSRTLTPTSTATPSSVAVPTASPTLLPTSTASSTPTSKPTATNTVSGAPTSSASSTPTVTPTGGEVAAPSVLQHHHSSDRRGVYIVPQLTTTAAATLVRDTSFTPGVDGNVYAQPLYVADAGGNDRVFVATESNQVSAFSAADGSIVWQRTLAPALDGSYLPCGNINPLGITGTPVIDLPSRTLFLDAMTDSGAHRAAHKIYALSLDDGSIRPGWPVDANSAIAVGGARFKSIVQNQRPALTILAGKVYVAYGGLSGDCGTYYGWLVGLDMSNPAALTAWRSPLVGTALWGMSGPSTDGQYVYMTSGNSTEPPSHTWQGTEAILRWSPGPVFSGQPADYFVPSDFFELDESDLDLGGTAPILVDLRGPPAASLAVALGKDGTLYLADRTNLGGIGGQLFQMHVANAPIINAGASYATAQGTYVVFKALNGIGCPGAVGDLMAVRLLPGTRPSATIAWCANQGGGGSPMVTQTQLDGGTTIVWGLGTESAGEGPGDSRLHGFDGDTGAVVYAGGGTAEQMGPLHRFITPIAAGGRIFVAGDNRVYAFKVP